MSRQKPASIETIQGLVDRIDILLKNGAIANDFVINTEEAAAITGLSPETIRYYGKTRYFSVYKYPGKNLYPCKEVCEWVLSKYTKKILANTTQINGSSVSAAVRRGRPRKGSS